jgi:inosine-uridine nucleoside N-ribohydrolase
MSGDDVVAVLYLLSHPEVEVLGIGSADGVAHVEPSARNVLRLLALVGREDIPVAVGSEISLESDHAFPSSWREGADDLFGLSVPGPAAKPVEESTAALLADVVNARPGEVTVVLLGAHTDLALALREDPGLAQRIRAVHTMGGAVYVQGNIYQEYRAIKNETAEWNLWLDYQAAAEVFAAGIPLTVVPLDATNLVRVDASYAGLFASEAVSSAAEAIVQLWKSQSSWSPSGFYIWDAVAAVALTLPDIAGWEALALDIVTEEAQDLGRTLVVSDRPANAQVCLTVDVARLQGELIRVLNY